MLRTCSCFNDAHDRNIIHGGTYSKITAKGGGLISSPVITAWNDHHLARCSWLQSESAATSHDYTLAPILGLRTALLW